MTTESCGTLIAILPRVRGDDGRGGGADAVDVGCRSSPVCSGSVTVSRAMRSAFGKLAFAAAEAPAERAKMQRLVRHAGADAARFHRVAKAAAVDLQALERQQDGEHVPAVAVVRAGRPRRQHARRVGLEAGEVAVDQRATPGEELRQPLELRVADARVDVGQVELAAGERDVARAVGQVP